MASALGVAPPSWAAPPEEGLASPDPAPGRRSLGPKPGRAVTPILERPGDALLLPVWRRAKLDNSPARRGVFAETFAEGLAPELVWS
jgi:hypothetical protein